MVQNRNVFFLFFVDCVGIESRQFVYPMFSLIQEAWRSNALLKTQRTRFSKIAILRFPPCFKNNSRGALLLSSKTVPKTEENGREAAAQENGTGAERLPYARSGTQMGNKGRTKNVRMYGEHGVCNTLCLFMYPLLRRSYRICFSFYSKQKTVSGANQTSRERNEHLIMGERKIRKFTFSK